MQRYGTDMTKWTSGEFDDDDDDDDLEYEKEEGDDDNDSGGDHRSSTNAFARSPSVFDPWEDLPQLSTSTPAATTNRAGSDDTADLSESLLENQPQPPRMREERTTSASRVSSSPSTTVTTSTKVKS